MIWAEIASQWVRSDTQVTPWLRNEGSPIKHNLSTIDCALRLIAFIISNLNRLANWFVISRSKVRSLSPIPYSQRKSVI